MTDPQERLDQIRRLELVQANTPCARHPHGHPLLLAAYGLTPRLPAHQSQIWRTPPTC